MQTITLTGYLGRDREIRDTRTRVLRVRRWNDVAECYDEGEAETASREYAVLSLATHRRGRDGWETRWHRLIVFDLDRMDRFNVRLARKGDRVRVTGRPEVFRFVDEEGREREVQQVVVDSYECLAKKVGRRAA